MAKKHDIEENAKTNLVPLQFKPILQTNAAIQGAKFMNNKQRIRT